MLIAGTDTDPQKVNAALAAQASGLPFAPITEKDEDMRQRAQHAVVEFPRTAPGRDRAKHPTVH